jgi:hypothetical protein
LFFKIIKLTTKHKNLDFLSQIHLGDGCEMVNTKIFKNFNTRIFLQQNLCSRAYILNSKQMYKCSRACIFTIHTTTTILDFLHKFPHETT